MSIKSVMPSNHLILCHPLLLLPSIPPSIRVFSKESVLRIRWSQYWSFSFSIRPSNEYSGLIFFGMDWFELLVVQGTLKSLLQHHSSKASILWHSAFFMVQLSHPKMTTGKTIALTIWIFVGKVMSLFLICCPGMSQLFFQAPNILILCLQWFWSPKNKVWHCFHCFPICLPWTDGTRCHDVCFLNVELEANFFTLHFHFHQEAF